MGEPTVEMHKRADDVMPAGGVAPRRARRESRLWRRTTMQRAVVEAVCLFIAGRLLAMVPIELWPASIYPLVLIARLALTLILPPAWAALRVVSTRREKMSQRFWWLGPRLAVLCAAADALIALTLGDALFPWGGPVGQPDIVRLLGRGEPALSLASFLESELTLLAVLLVFYTIGVVCTRLANGGFLRFTMPAGDGRVTL